MEVKSKKRVGILRGGTGKYYASSLKKGGEIILHISENLADKYKVFDILVDKDYIWHLNGVPVNPGDLISKVDVVWNTSHPSFSNILESLSIPNIGIGFFSSIFREQQRNVQRACKQNRHKCAEANNFSKKRARSF